MLRFGCSVALLLGALGCGEVTREPPAAQAGAAGTAAGGSGGQATAGQPAGGAESLAGGGAGAGGSEAGGSSGGGSDDVNAVLPSSGCGRPLPAEQVMTVPRLPEGYTAFVVNQTGATLGADQPTAAGERQFFVRVPVDYDPNRAYRVVYVGQGCGGRRSADTRTLPLFDEQQGGSEQAVYVAVSIPDNDANNECYDNNRGPESQEWEAFQLIHDFVESTYCVDNHRIFVGGYSSGAWLANMWGCYFAGTSSPPLDEPDVAAGRSERKFAPRWAVRGRAAIAGRLPMNQPLPCNGPSAGLWIHSDIDVGTPIGGNIGALEAALAANGCTGNYADGPKEPWPAGEAIQGFEGLCQRYTGCPADIQRDYPLVFCTTHTPAQAGPQPQLTVPAFTAFFDSMAPAP